jgi:hypothetical protein
MLCMELIAVCSEIHIKHINALCGQNVEFANVKPAGTYSNQEPESLAVLHEYILTLGSRLRWAVNFTRRPIYPTPATLL